MFNVNSIAIEFCFAYQNKNLWESYEGKEEENVVFCANIDRFFHDNTRMNMQCESIVCHLIYLYYLKSESI